MHLRIYDSRLIWELMITEGNKQKRQDQILTLPFPSLNLKLIYFLKNFFLPYPANPIKPDSRRSMVVGSGTGVCYMDQ